MTGMVYSCRPQYNIHQCLAIYTTNIYKRTQHATHINTQNVKISTILLTFSDIHVGSINRVSLENDKLI